MALTQWDRRFFESTRGRVVSLLRWRRHTIEELSRELELTDNAIRSHVAALERDGIVRQRGVRRGVGKPSYDYELTSNAEQLFPKAYEPVLGELLSVLAERLAADEIAGILDETGSRLAERASAPSGELRARLDAAVSLLSDLGGLATVEETAEGYLIQGYSCPLFALVPDHPEVCRLAESLLSTFSKAPVRECCDRGERPRCRFLVDAPAPAGEPRVT
ncbi:MAG TPA: ArsR family transcriptional regulator [Thermomicrobiales bacterium]|nr:ArsR family transcriptional regulator [Thermomicrobiales bacterium]